MRGPDLRPALQGQDDLAAFLLLGLRGSGAPSAGPRTQEPAPAVATPLQVLPGPDPRGAAQSAHAARLMKLDELMRFAGRFFDEEGADYYVFGATAMNFWIPPRMTADLDVVLCTDKSRARRLVEKLRRHKFRLDSMKTRLLLEGRLIKLPLGESELDLKLGRSEHEREALSRSKVFAGDDFRLRIAVPEDLVLFKLQSWRRQDQADIERLWKSRRDLDVPYIKSWFDRLTGHTGLPISARWADIRGS